MKKRIYVVTHKEFVRPQNTLYCPIQVGKKNTNLELDMISDDVGDNISDKNSNYCELTAFYWIWKNVHDCEWVGLCHYRRYFSSHKYSKNEKYFISTDVIDSLLGKYDIIVPKKLYWNGKCVKEMYDYGRRPNDLEIIRQILIEKCPEYVNSYDKILNSKSAFYRNMLIARKEIFDEYCTWLFSVLFDLEKKLISQKSLKPNSRIFGFISEFLLDVWVEKKQLNYKEYNIVNIEERPIAILKGNLVNFYNRLMG